MNLEIEGIFPELCADIEFNDKSVEAIVGGEELKETSFDQRMRIHLELILKTDDCGFLAEHQYHSIEGVTWKVEDFYTKDGLTCITYTREAD